MNILKKLLVIAALAFCQENQIYSETIIESIERNAQQLEQNANLVCAACQERRKEALAAREAINRKKSAFLDAVRHNKPKDVRRLIADHTDIYNTKYQGEKPLYLAVSHGNTELVQILLDAGLDPKDVPNILIRAAVFPRNANVVRQLIATGVNLDATDQYGDTALIAAINNLQWDSAHALIDAGANLNILGARNYTALTHAVRRNQTELAQSLLEHGADPSLGSENLINMARGYGNRELMDLLKKYTK